MKPKLITNNPEVITKTKYDGPVIEVKGNYLEVCLKVRDLLHLGYPLLTHPLSGSVKPNETPYKSVLVGNTIGKLDIEGIQVIEETINTIKKLGLACKTLDEKTNEDFKIIDADLISHVLKQF